MPNFTDMYIGTMTTWKLYLKYHHQHGAVLQRDSDGDTYYCDTGAKFVMKEPTIEKIVLSMVVYKRIEFKKILHGDLYHRKGGKEESEMDWWEMIMSAFNIN